MELNCIFKIVINVTIKVVYSPLNVFWFFFCFAVNAMGGSENSGILIFQSFNPSPQLITTAQPTQEEKEEEEEEEEENLINLEVKTPHVTAICTIQTFDSFTVATT